MGWDRGRYSSRSRKVHGRVVREYVGTGRVAELAAQLGALEREQCRLDALALRQEKAELAALEAEVKALAETVDLVARAALRAAAYHRHKRGEGRKRREQSQSAQHG